MLGNEIFTLQGLSRTNQYGLSQTLACANKIETMMHAVDQIDVCPARRAKHDLGSGSGATPSVASSIDFAVMTRAVGFHLGDAQNHAPAIEHSY